jgi:plasmid stabilization system protein ParE
VKGYAFLEPARDELAEAVEFYNDRRSGLGDDLAAEVERAIDRVLHSPRACPQVSANVRRCHVPRFPYGLLYQIRGQEILIVAVMHSRRDPEYWKERLS